MLFVWALMSFTCGCAQIPAGPHSGLQKAREIPTFGRIRMIENGQAITWGKLFDRPTPELLDVENGRLLNRIDLSGGIFSEAFEQDGSFCWNLPPGTYRVLRIVPWQDVGLIQRDDLRTNIYPEVSFRIPENADAVYLGTLEIAMAVRRDLLGTKRMSGVPTIRVLDELPQSTGNMCFAGDVQTLLMSSRW